MIVRDVRYIIKRIIVGVGIALILSFLRGDLLLGVHAKEISSVWMPFSSHVVVVDNLDNTLQFTPSNNGHWANWGFGYLRFNFSIVKVSGDSTSPLVIPNNVNVNNYVCDVSSTSVGNSTFTGATYSATCPMIMGSTGLGNMYILLTDNQQNSLSNYRVTVGGLVTFEKVDDVTLDTSSTTNAINNQITNDNSNTQSIINNNNSNTQSIINNQNTNTEKEIESQKVCKNIDKTNATFNGYLQNNTGSYVSNTSSYFVTDFININSTSKIKVLLNSTESNSTCFYDDSRQYINCIRANSMTNNSYLTIPNNAKYVRFTINSSTNRPQFELCNNGNQAIVDSQQEINNSLNDSNVDSASSQASDFFNNFNATSHGLSGIITSPLRLIQSLSTSTCSSLVIPLPFVNQSATIPCMSSIYSLYPTFYNLWQLITTGLICYWIVIKIFGHVKGMQNPNDDRIEVVDL